MRRGLRLGIGATSLDGNKAILLLPLLPCAEGHERINRRAFRLEEAAAVRNFLA